MQELHRNRKSEEVIEERRRAKEIVMAEFTQFLDNTEPMALTFQAVTKMIKSILGEIEG